MSDKELPQDLTDRIAREENEADRAAMRKYLVEPVKAAGKRLYENVMGTPEQNKAAQERMDKAKGKKAGGMVSSKLEKAGFYDKDKTKSERKKIVSKVTTKPQRLGMVEKMFSAKKIKSGGTVSTASKRGDGCAIKGKTKGRMV
jgi:hypothetical protein